MKYIETEWALVNHKTGELYRVDYGNKAICTFFSRESARDEKDSLIHTKTGGKEFRVERVKVTYERIHTS